MCWCAIKKLLTHQRTIGFEACRLGDFEMWYVLLSQPLVCLLFTAPKISDLTVTSCVVDWMPLKPLGSDSLTYVLQLQRISSRDQDYHEASCILQFKWLNDVVLSNNSSQSYGVSLPRTHRYLASHAFAIAAPSSWNSLPDNVRDSDSYSSFLSKLKTHYFNTAFYNHVICYCII